jgi:Family of unknown function (DUF5681)
MSDVVPAKKALPHQFQKGQSGNPAGRPKGSKNALSLIKLQVEGELRSQSKSRMREVVEEMFRQALPSQERDKDGNLLYYPDGTPRLVSGDRDMLKALYNSWVSKTKSSEDESPKEKIQIIIGKLDQVPPVSGRVVAEDSTTTQE